MVLVRAFQQKNNQYDREVLGFFTSYAMATTEYLMIWYYVNEGLYPLFVILAAGTGGGLGMVTALKINKRMMRR